MFVKKHKNPLKRTVRFSRKRSFYLVGRKRDITFACAAWDYAHKLPYKMLKRMEALRDIPF